MTDMYVINFFIQNKQIYFNNFLFLTDQHFYYRLTKFTGKTLSRIIKHCQQFSTCAYSF